MCKGALDLLCSVPERILHGYLFCGAHLNYILYFFFMYISRDHLNCIVGSQYRHRDKKLLICAALLSLHYTFFLSLSLFLSFIFLSLPLSLSPLTVSVQSIVTVKQSWGLCVSPSGRLGKSNLSLLFRLFMSFV